VKPNVYVKRYIYKIKVNLMNLEEVSFEKHVSRYQVTGKREREEALRRWGAISSKLTSGQP
jgi:hypothetical protein